MIALFLGVGTVWFWMFLAVISIVLMAIQENSQAPGSWSTFWVIATFVALYYLGAGGTIRDLGLHIYHNPIETVVYFLLYTVAGTVWSFFKWKEVVDEAVVAYNEDVEKYKNNGDSNSKPNWNEKFYLNRRRPQLDENKAKIFNWIFYWPFSLSWYCIHEPVERLFRTIMKHTKKIYEGITDRAFAKVKDAT